MKTVVIYKEYLLNVSETFIAEQARALKRYQPKYVGLTRPDPSLAFEGDPLYLNTGSWSDSRVKLYRRFPIAPLFHNRIRALSPDLIHAHFASDALQMAPLSQRFHIPLIVTLHGFDVTVRQQFAPRYNQVWNQTSVFLCVSEFIRAKAMEAGFPAEKLKVHRIGIDLSKFNLPPAPRDPKLVLFVGRLVEKKGCMALLRAMAFAQAAVPGASLAIIGDGPLRSSLTTIAADLGLSCQFLGPQPPSQVNLWMQKAGIFCVPSQTAANGDSEGLGMVFLEAQACGLPVVSTLHGGIPEAVNQGQTGLLVPENDPDSLAEALITYLKDPALAARHGSNGRPWVAEAYDLFKQTEVLEDIYDSVLSR